MSASRVLVAADFGSPQSELNATPKTMAQAETIKPTTKLTMLTGATQIKNIGTIINPGDPDEYVEPVQAGYHELIFIPASGSTLLTTGNIANAVELTVGLPNLLVYNPITKKYYGFAGNLT